MTEPEPNLASDPVVFSRPLSLRGKLALASLLILAILAFVLLVAGKDWLVELLKGTSLPGDPFLTVMLTLLMCEVLLGTAFCVGIVAGRRRYGHCELLGDQAVFSIALTLGGKLGRVTISLNDVTARTEVPGGILLRVQERGRWANTMFPLLIPTETDAELAQAVALLDRTELEETLERDADEARFGRPFPVLLHVLMAGAVLLPFAVAGPLLLDLLFQVSPKFVLFGGAVLTPSLILAIIGFVMLTTRFRRAKVGREAILIGNRRLPYAEIQRLAKAPPFLACEGPKKKDLIWVGDQLEEAARVLDDRFEAAGLALRVESTTPPWAGQSRRRVRASLVGGLYGLLILALAALYVRPLEIYGSITAHDDLDNTVRLVYRLGDEAPVFLLLDTSKTGSGRARYYLEDSVRISGLFEQTLDDGDTLVVDLVEGVGRVPGASFPIPPATTCLNLDPKGRPTTADASLPPGLAKVLLEDAIFGMVFDVQSLPALLEQADPEPKNPVLADFVSGRSSNRTFEAVDAEGWRFAWGMSEGEPVFAFAARASQGVQVVLDPFLLDIGPKNGGVMLFEPRHKLTVVWADGEINSAAAEAPLPGVEILRAFTERIRAGETVVAATQAFLGEQWPSAD